MSYHRVCCVTDAPQELQLSQKICWQRSGLFRWNFIDHHTALGQVVRPASDTLIVHAGTDGQMHFANTLTRLWRDGILLDNSGSLKAPADRTWRSLRDWELADYFERMPIGRAAPGFIWANQTDPFVRTMRARVSDSILGLILEKYFPNSTEFAVIHRVSGGLSGVPLIRAAITNAGEFYIKLFDVAQEFIDEWEQHHAARKWMGPVVVKMRSIPELDPSGAAQIMAFPGQGAGSVFPICYEAAVEARTLKEQYRRGVSTQFIIGAYQKVIRAFGSNQRTPTPAQRHLLQLEVCGPFRSRPGQAATLIGEIRKDETRLLIETALSSNSHHIRYAARHNAGGGIEIDWQPLEKLLHGNDPNWITTPVPIVHGHIHGDANSRNFLIADPPNTDPQIIDCGSHHEDAPRLFDLAQMESDLVVNLTAIETDAPGYGEIDTRLLHIWVRQQKTALSVLAGFPILRRAPEVLRRVYEIVGALRQDAQALSSPHDLDGRAYFFFLLYWMIRKLYLLDKGLPHIKSSIALHAAGEICARFERWS